MKNLLKILTATLMVMTLTSAKAEFKFGVGVMGGLLSTDGKEVDPIADTSQQTKSLKEKFVGGDVFVENIFDNGIAVGLSYVPYSIDIGSVSRTDTGINDDDTGTRFARAELDDLSTLYVNYPFGDAGGYMLGGIHYATIVTTETLPETTYGNEDIYGVQLGAGQRVGNMKYEIAYSNFETISIAGSGTSGLKAEADADALMFRVSYGF